MKNLNFIGNLGGDAELKTLQEGVVLNFNVAIYEGKKKDGTARPATWISCQYFFTDESKTTVKKYLVKGAKVFVSGRPRVNAYLNKSNEPQAELVCVVESLYVVSSVKGDESEIPSF